MARNQKKKKGINAFDAVVILLLLCLFATFAYRIYTGFGESDDGVAGSKYVMEFQCDKEYNSILRYLEGGDAVYFASDGKLLGYLYVGSEYENGAIYEIADVGARAALPETPSEEQTEMTLETVGAEDGAVEIESGANDGYYLPTPTLPAADQFYHLVRLGGQLALNSETVKVKNGNYYSIGDTNFTVGSVIEVYTDDAVFTLKVAKISLMEQ
jgi:hypothetical protein